MSAISQVRVHGVDQVQLDSIAHPRAGPDDVVVRVAWCGICGSDLSYIAMGGLLGPDNPMPLGHELSGVIEEVGDRVDSLAVGDRVVVNPEGNGNRIGNSGPEGAFTPYLLVRGVTRDQRCVHRLPEGLNFEQGALVEPLSVSMHAVHQGGVQPGDKVVVFGAGPIGLGAVLVLGYYGVRDVVVVDLSAYRLGQAEQLGATTFHADSGDLAEFLMARHGRAEVLGAPVPATDVYLEVTGVAAVFNQITGLARVGARLVVVGLHSAPVELNLVNVLLRELRIIGSMAYPDEFPQAIEMLASGRVDTGPMISHRFALSDFPAALARAQDAAGAMKVLIDCQR